MQRITIVGLDNIGASMGLALKRWIGEAQKADPNGALEVVGFDYDVARQRAAERVHAVDRTQWSLSKAVQDASLVVLALPANETREVCGSSAPYSATTPSSPTRRPISSSAFVGPQSFSPGFSSWAAFR
ncbi:MAG: hypothetical protein WKH64_17545 [Chloroflexia bacterium]